MDCLWLQICHLDEVTQWHEDNGVVQTDAQWSLGHIQMPADMGLFKVHETTGTGALVQHEFNGGQECHEIGKPRSGVLHYICNPEAQAAQELSSKKAAQEMYSKHPRNPRHSLLYHGCL